MNLLLQVVQINSIPIVNNLLVLTDMFFIFFRRLKTAITAIAVERIVLGQLALVHLLLLLWLQK